MNHEPRVTDLTNRSTPDERRAKARAGEGFYMPSTASRDAVLAYMRLHLAQRTEWDEAPELGVFRAEFDEHVTGYAFPYPESLWNVWDHPGRLINRLSVLTWEQGRTEHALLRPIDRSMLGDMTGVYLRTEAWAPPKGAERTALTLHTQGHGYRFSEVQGRREVRSVEYVQGDGTVFSVSQYRDEPDTFVSQAWHPGDSSETSYMGGKLATGMLRLAFGLIKYMRTGPITNPEHCDPITEQERKR